LRIIFQLLLPFGVWSQPFFLRLAEVEWVFETLLKSCAARDSKSLFLMLSSGIHTVSTKREHRPVLSSHGGGRFGAALRGCLIASLSLLFA
jgi:hypothetical protein